MQIDLVTPTSQALKEFNEDAERPYFIASSCLLDGGAVELEIGGVTIAGIFDSDDAYTLALGVLDMETPERPQERDCDVNPEVILQFDTPEQRAEIYTLEELEYEAWSALHAIAILENAPVDPSEAPVAAQESEVAPESVETVEAPQNGSQPFGGQIPFPKQRVRSDFMWNRDAYYPPRTLEPVGLMSHEEVAARFDNYVTGAAA